MHYIDESESNDRDIKSDQRSIKVPITEHTNDETQDDECVQTMSKESSKVRTPTVTGRIDCEGPDRRQRRSIDQPEAISTMDGDGQNSREISLTRSRETQKSGVCSPRKMFIYQRKFLRRSLRPKGAAGVISHKIGIRSQTL